MLWVASDYVNAVRNIHVRVLGGTGQSSWKSKSLTGGFTRVEFVHEGRRSNIDAHCLARSSVNFSVGRYVWFVAPADGVCTSYPDK
jgi:hypothetical protein